MKKLVAVTTTILIILIAVLGVIMIKGSAGTDSSSAKATLSDLKESLTGSSDTAQEQTSGEMPDEEYDGELLKLNKQMETITYEGRDFKVKFANPFYEEGSDNYVSVIFYDENHGYLLKSLGEGTDSAFYEAYKTEDGCQTWNKCAADVWLFIYVLLSMRILVPMRRPSATVQTAVIHGRHSRAIPAVTVKKSRH